MKKNILIAVVVVLSVFNLIGAMTQSTSANVGKLECSDLTGCGSSASCPGKGTVSGCNIVCEGGESITCPRG